MFNKEEVRQQIIQYFKAVGSGENIIQAIKQALFLNQNFSPLVIFQMLSQGKQKITKNDWKKYLLKKNIPFSDKEIRYFFRHNHFKDEITLNEFLQALMPYNADVIREFKSKYLQSLEIEEIDSQVDFIFAQLMKNWVDFLRNLIQIRTQISQTVTKKQIDHLIKQDLVLYSKPREARKFHQSFQQSKFDLSFHELRKFLQLWVTPKQIVHQFCLLNVKRHIKSENPFEKIVIRNRQRKEGQRSRSRSQSRSLSFSRSVSRNKETITESKRKPVSTGKKLLRQEKVRQQDQQIFKENKKQRYSIYQEYKKQLLKSFQDDTILNKGSNEAKLKREFNPEKERKIEREENVGAFSSKRRNQTALINQVLHTKGTKQQAGKEEKTEVKVRQKKKTEQTLILTKILHEIIIKQDRLQKLRKQLAKSNDFNLINLFKLIDSSNKGFINDQSLQKFTQSNLEFENTVKYYGREKDKVRFQEFNGIFRPLSKELNEALDSRAQNRLPNPFKKQTMRLILEILQLEGEMHNNLENLKKKVKDSGIKGQNLFQQLDRKNKGYISCQDIEKILDQSNINFEGKDLKCLMKLFHKKIDEKISQKEFLTFLNF